MRAMVLDGPGLALRLEERASPTPAAGEIRIRVEACAVCRTDLHIVDGDLAAPHYPVVPGHEIVGIVEAAGDGENGFALGARVGVPWLGHACGSCPYCASERENLCDAPLFTGHGRDGGYATQVTAEARFCIGLDAARDPVALAPLLCAGVIGWRSLRMAGDAACELGLYGFGAAAHLIAQVAIHQGRRVYAFTRPGDLAGQDFARSLGATWAGGSDEAPPRPLDAAIIFAPVGELVPRALKSVRKGARVVCGGIHMSDIPQFAYSLLWQERELLSVANMTREDARQFMRASAGMTLDVRAKRYPLEAANQALDDLRRGRIEGAAVLVPA